MFFDMAHNWVIRSNKFSDVFHNLEVYIVLFLTVGLKKSFACDGKLWLCFCCQKLRWLIRTRHKFNLETMTIYKGSVPYVFQSQNIKN